VSAVWGGIATGCFATPDSGYSTSTGATKSGLFYGGGYQFAYNIAGSVTSAAYAFAITFLILFVLGKVMNAKVSEEEEHEGLDAAIHGEENDPLTEKDVINILRSMNNFSSVGGMLIKHASSNDIKQTGSEGEILLNPDTTNKMNPISVSPHSPNR